MTTLNTPSNTTTDQEAQATAPGEQSVAPALPPDTLELPSMLQNTDALEALLKKVAGQLP